jgi:hypothetical protein
MNLADDLLTACSLAHRSLLGLGLGVSLSLRAAVVQIHLNPNTGLSADTSALPDLAERLKSLDASAIVGGRLWRGVE